MACEALTAPNLCLTVFNLRYYDADLQSRLQAKRVSR